MAEYLLVASICSLLLPVVAAWHRDRIKDGHNVLVRRAIRVWAACSILVVALSAANVYMTRRQAVALRVAEQSLQVLRGLSKYRMELLDRYFQLIGAAATVRNYAMYEKARLASGHADVLPKWESRVNDELRGELNQARSAFERSQRIAREVLIQQATYPAFVPKALGEWATLLLAAKFEEVPEFIDPYHVGPRSLQYAKLFGEAIGSVTGAEMQATEKLTQ